uniref:glutathione transferase n=1 Tax=Mycena chlorophos TaxID=658473 RepID=A0ABQ0LYN9_MYCCL|nr:glutathione transferase [Mycena chlorophos]
MVLKLYSAPLVGIGGNAGIVALVLAEKRIPFEDVPLDFLIDEQKQPKHRTKHPFGQVPVLEDEDGPQASLRERALFEQAASVEFADFHNAAGLVFAATVKAELHGLQIDCKAVEDGMATLIEVLEAYEQILSRQKYAAGNELTIVDFFHLVPMYALVMKGLVGDAMTCDARPNVARWWKAISSRPEWIRLRDEGITSRISYYTESSEGM